MSERILRSTDYFGAIVSAATLAPPGVEVVTDLRCRRRPQRRRCHGLIRLRLQEKPAELIWWCPQCGDNGIIRNWKGIPWTLVHTRTDDISNCDEYCEILLSKKEYALLTEISILESGAIKAVEDARVKDDAYVIVGSVEDIDDLMGYIAFEANHEQKPRRRLALNRLFDKFSDSIEGKW